MLLCALVNLQKLIIQFHHDPYYRLVTRKKLNDSTMLNIKGYYSSGLQIIDFMELGYIKACSAASTTPALLSYIPVF